MKHVPNLRVESCAGCAEGCSLRTTTRSLYRNVSAVCVTPRETYSVSHSLAVTDGGATVTLAATGHVKLTVGVISLTGHVAM